MRASITADPTRGPGYGIIEVRGAGHMPDPVFVIYRSDGKSLSGGGWQESESALRPDAWENDGGNLRLAVGPAVVNEMDNLESYRISLPGSGLCPLSVQNLVYSHMGGGQGVGSFVPLPDPSPVQPQVAPEPGPEREPEPSPDPGPVEIPPAPLAEPLQLPSDGTEQKHGKTVLLAVLLLLLLLAAAALWWFYLRAPEAPPCSPLHRKRLSAPITLLRPTNRRWLSRGSNCAAKPALKSALLWPSPCAQQTPQPKKATRHFYCWKTRRKKEMPKQCFWWGNFMILSARCRAAVFLWI